MALDPATLSGALVIGVIAILLEKWVTYILSHTRIRWISEPSSLEADLGGA
jgi:hypothetical protein